MQRVDLRSARAGALALAIVLVASIGAVVIVGGSAPLPAALTPSPVRALGSLGDSAHNYSVSFEETGLPAGTWWSVTFDGRTYTTPGNPTISFSAANGSYPFSDSAPGYNATPAHGVVVVNGTPLTVAISFSNRTVAYSVTFTESGLPSGTDWNISLNGTLAHSSSPTITFVEPNGTYDYTVGAVAGYTTNYTGNVTVNGAAVQRTVVYAESVYLVGFEARGLPDGVYWSIMIANSTVSSMTPMISDELPNGSYNFSVRAADGYATATPGTLEVDAQPLTVGVNFSQTTYAVTFSEVGLPVGTNWQVDFAGNQSASSNATIAFQVPNGTYRATFSAGADYSVSPSQMELNVSGAATGGQIRFTPIPFSVEFTETGLPGGNWSVALSTSTGSSPAGSSISFEVPDGSYSYRVAPIPGFTSASTGMVDVEGANQTVAVVFAAVDYVVSLRASDLPAGTPWSANIAPESYNTTGSTITFSLPNGSYAFSTLSLNFSWQTLDPFDNVTVEGANVVLTIPFAYAYPASFVATGLPSGATWTVNVTGSATGSSAVRALSASSTAVRYSYTSAIDQLVVPLPNGTYTYTVSSSSPQWTPRASGTSLVVDGASPPPQSVASTGAVGPTSNGSSDLLIEILAVVVAAVVISVGAVSYRQAARRRSPSTLPGFDELYGSYELATDVDLGGGLASGDPLDDIF